MKTTVVPAQITTIEDRIAGRLGLSQLLLLVAPVFLDSALYIVAPPFFHSATYKLVLMVTVLFICGLMAIRIKGKIILLWLVVSLKYKLRPRYYIYNKNTLLGREQSSSKVTAEPETETETISQPQRELLPLTIAEVTRVQSLMENPDANLSFVTTKKGGLRVHFTEVEEQS